MEMPKKGEKINKENYEIITDSLWIFDERDKSFGHSGWYHGNFIPQIPRQLILRFTKEGDVIVDPFLGSGTTLIECVKLKRNGIGIELVPRVAKLAQTNIQKILKNLFQNTNENLFYEVVTGDSTNKNTLASVKNILLNKNKKYVQLVIMHPPYHDIIKFSNLPEDLSNTKDISEFLDKFSQSVNLFLEILQSQGHLCVVIGDKYSKGEWVPLGFLVMDRIRNDFKKQLVLKSIIVKNIVNNRGKRNQENLWRYRALKGGFYIFRHEYILIFKKIQ